MTNRVDMFYYKIKNSTDVDAELLSADSSCTAHLNPNLGCSNTAAKREENRIYGRQDMQRKDTQTDMYISIAAAFKPANSAI